MRFTYYAAVTFLVFIIHENCADHWFHSKRDIFFCLFVRIARTWCVSHKIARGIYVYTHVQCVLHTCRKTKCERSTSHHSRNVFEHTRTMIPLKSFVYMVHFFEASRWGYRWKILRNTIFRTDFCIDLFTIELLNRLHYSDSLNISRIIIQLKNK